MPTPTAPIYALCLILAREALDAQIAYHIALTTDSAEAAGHARLAAEALAAAYARELRSPDVENAILTHLRLRADDFDTKPGAYPSVSERLARAYRYAAARVEGLSVAVLVPAEETYCEPARGGHGGEDLARGT